MQAVQDFDFLVWLDQEEGNVIMKTETFHLLMSEISTRRKERVEFMKSLAKAGASGKGKAKATTESRTSSAATGVSGKGKAKPWIGSAAMSKSVVCRKPSLRSSKPLQLKT